MYFVVKQLDYESCEYVKLYFEYEKYTEFPYKVYF